MRDLLSGAAASLAGLRKAYPGQSARLRPLERAHRSHLRELGEDAGGRVLAVTPRGLDPAAVLRQVDRTEDRLDRQLVRAAIAAESGSLAQLFASMSAANAQLRAEL